MYTLISSARKSIVLIAIIDSQAGSPVVGKKTLHNTMRILTIKQTMEEETRRPEHQLLPSGEPCKNDLAARMVIQLNVKGRGELVPFRIKF